VVAGDGSAGKRIAKYRKLRGLTQRGLAMRANVAYGTLTKIESGHALASPVVIAALARTLSVNVARLTGQPFLDELNQAGVDQLIEPLRVALDRFDLPPSEDSVRIPVGWPATRAAHHHMDLGRAHAVLGHHDQALVSLAEARRLAPQQTRFHPTTRQTVEYLLAARRRLPEALASYARWVGV
jgi:transcriptional regulator with XRE-family HTH domain